MVLWNILFIDVFLNSLSQHTLGLQHQKIPYISHNEKLKMKKIYGNIDQWLTKLYPNKNICRNLPRNLFLYLLLYEPFETFKNSGMINWTYFWIRNLRFGIAILEHALRMKLNEHNLSLKVDQKIMSKIKSLKFCVK